MKRIGVDVGGTFTDLIYVDDEKGTVLVHKTPSTPADPSIATVDGISTLCQMAGIKPSELDQVFHGTTVATNIVIEHNGANVGMITTKGYRDIIHIARHKKPMNFSLWQNLPWQAFPIARRRNRLTVNERILADGSVQIPLNDREVRAQVRKLKKAAVDSVAVCLLFSFLNDEHEKRVAAIVREEFPEAYLSVSSEVIPQYREYERFSTVALNAFVGPKVSNYVRRFDAELRRMGVKTGIQLMTSAAGVATPEAASERPVNLLMSGPIAGVVGGIWAGRVAGERNVITLDVGGTSADIGLAQDGKLRMKHLLDTKVGPYQAMIPMVDVDTIGAGGGSIAYVDSGGIFRVGPRSAGAMPGPAAYNQGGTEPTATDAIIALGWLRPELFLGGKKDLRVDLARKAVETKIAKPLKLSTEEAALGIFKVLVHSMVDAIEQSSVRKGFDPREFALVAEGGGGPLFASHIAPEVGVKHVLVPNYPGITAALGLLTTDLVYEYTKTAYVMCSSLTGDAKASANLEKQFAALEKEAMRQFAVDKIDKKRIRLERIVDARYEGQGYELRVDAPRTGVDDKWIKAVKNEFHAAHVK
jgi:N-methylhydantoinase A/oxoprolinase/acetone carboxylase beta subunit